jgi:hypothetical protein
MLFFSDGGLVESRLAGDPTPLTMTYGWQRFYEAAILETDRSALARLIQTAQAAIDVRMEQLQSDHHGSPEERQAIADALVGLNVLRKEVT